MKAVDANGRSLRIGRRWFAWRRRVHGLDADTDMDAPAGDDPLSLILAVWFGIVALIAGLVLVVALSELLLLLALVPVVFLWRVLAKRPWVVDVTDGRTLVASYETADWSTSQVLKDELAHLIRTRKPLPPSGR